MRLTKFFVIFAVLVLAFSIQIAAADFTIDSVSRPELLPKFYSDGKPFSVKNVVSCEPGKTAYAGISGVSCASTEDNTGLKALFSFDKLKLAERIDQKIPFKLTYLDQVYDFAITLVSEVVAGVAKPSEKPVDSTAASGSVQQKTSDVSFKVYRQSGDKFPEISADSCDGNYHVNQELLVKVEAVYDVGSAVSKYGIYCLGTSDRPQIKPGQESEFSTGGVDKKSTTYSFNYLKGEFTCEFSTKLDEKDKAASIKITSVPCKDAATKDKAGSTTSNKGTAGKKLIGIE